MEELQLQDNNLSSMPESSKKLKELMFLDLSGTNEFSDSEKKRIKKMFTGVFISFSE